MVSSAPHPAHTKTNKCPPRRKQGASSQLCGGPSTCFLIRGAGLCTATVCNALFESLGCRVPPEVVNVCCRFSEQSQVLDFGIAKAVAVSPATTTTGLTATGVAIGSFPYMAPERWTGGANGVPVDGRADLYALGCVLMELTTGARPFAAARDARAARPAPHDRAARAQPDLEWALTADSPVLLDVRRRLAHDAWLVGDVAGAALLYWRLFPNLAELAERGDPKVAHRVLRTIGEAGDPAAALAHLNPLLRRLPFLPGMQDLAQEVSDTRADFRRAVREQRRAEGTGGAGGLPRLFGR
ncbi:hypothetical protein [Streptomyces sp. NPDC085540]|uniref:protein kinase domain-containing protein n=1 Tax=Streptomyces sp. NPDC085540 TaxID=3365730 RepID=UPI0037D713A3